MTIQQNSADSPNHDQKEAGQTWKGSLSQQSSFSGSEGENEDTTTYPPLTEVPPVYASSIAQIVSEGNGGIFHHSPSLAEECQASERAKCHAAHCKNLVQGNEKFCGYHNRAAYGSSRTTSTSTGSTTSATNTAPSEKELLPSADSAAVNHDVLGQKELWSPSIFDSSRTRTTTVSEKVRSPSAGASADFIYNENKPLCQDLDDQRAENNVANKMAGDVTKSACSDLLYYENKPKGKDLDYQKSKNNVENKIAGDVTQSNKVESENFVGSIQTLKNSVVEKAENFITAIRQWEKNAMSIIDGRSTYCEGIIFEILTKQELKQQQGSHSSSNQQVQQIRCHLNIDDKTPSFKLELPMVKAHVAIVKAPSMTQVSTISLNHQSWVSGLVCIDEYLYVIHYDDPAIHIYNISSGQLHKHIAVPYLQKPCGMVAKETDGTTELVVMDHSQRLVFCTTGCEVKRIVELEFKPRGLCLDTSGNVIVINLSARAVCIFDKYDQLQTEVKMPKEIKRPWSAVPATSHEGANRHSISSFYITDWSDGSVYRVDQTGNIVNACPPVPNGKRATGAASPSRHQIMRPEHVTKNSQGGLIIADACEKARHPVWIMRRNGSIDKLGEGTISRNIIKATRVALDEDNNRLFLAHSTDNDKQMSVSVLPYYGENPVAVSNVDITLNVALGTNPTPKQ